MSSWAHALWARAMGSGVMRRIEIANINMIPSSPIWEWLTQGEIMFVLR